MADVALVIPVALAVTVVEPTLIAVTGTVAEVAFWAMVTVAGTEATPDGLEPKVTTSPPAGAGEDSVSVRFCEPGPVRVKLVCVKASFAPTLTVWVPVV